MMDIDTVHFHRLRVEVGAGKRRYVAGNGFAAVKLSLFVDVDQDRRDLQQRIGGFVESTGLDIDDDGQVAAKALRHRGYISHLLMSFQFNVSPARNGIRQDSG